MNIFATDPCPVVSAQHHCTVHFKLVVELAQLLSTAHHELDGHSPAYKPTHKNHPSTIWVRESRGNYQWAFEHFKALCDEYTFRTGKLHKTSEHLASLSVVPANIRKGERTRFAMAMDDKYKINVDPCANYRHYLNHKFKEWQQRDKPIKVCWGIRDVPSWVEI